MNEQTKSVVRTILKVVGTLLVQKGYTDDAGMEAITGGVLALAGVIWSVWQHKQEKKGQA